MEVLGVGVLIRLRGQMGSRSLPSISMEGKKLTCSIVRIIGRQTEKATDKSLIIHILHVNTTWLHTTAIHTHKATQKQLSFSSSRRMLQGPCQDHLLWYEPERR